MNPSTNPSPTRPATNFASIRSSSRRRLGEGGSRARFRFSVWICYGVLVLFAIISLGPIWIALKTALSDSSTLFTGASSPLPQHPTLFNFERVMGLVNPGDPRLQQTSFGKADFYRALMNSVAFTLLAVVPQIAFSAMAAYAFARLGHHSVPAAFKLAAAVWLIGPVPLILTYAAFIKLHRVFVGAQLLGWLIKLVIVAGAAAWFLH